jgi:hypothetical protein
MKHAIILLVVLEDIVSVMELVHAHHSLHVLLSVQVVKRDVQELEDRLVCSLVHVGYGVQLQIVRLEYVVVQEYVKH